MTLTEHQNKILHAFVAPDEKRQWKAPPKEIIYGPTSPEYLAILPATVYIDYTSQPHFDAFLKKLFGEKKMYRRFEGWLFHEKYKQDHVDRIGIVDTRLFVPYFFHPDHRERFLTLFLEFLALPETQEGVWV